MKQHEATFTEAADPQEASAVNEEPNPSEKSRCSQLNKKGEPCKAWAMHADPLGRCPAHAGVALKNLDPVRAQQASAENRKQRVEARKLSVLDWTAKKLEEKAEQIVDSYLRAGEQGDWRALDALVNRVYGRATERIEQVAGESEVDRALKQLSREDLQAMVQKGRQEQEVRAIMRVMTAEERDEFLGRMAPEERREVLGERDLAEQRERERREEMRLRGFDPDDPRPKEAGTPEDFAWKDRRIARLRAVEQEAV
jgi:hypothetical protein